MQILQQCNKRLANALEHAGRAQAMAKDDRAKLAQGFAHMRSQLGTGGREVVAGLNIAMGSLRMTALSP
jgi:hypothetical protein